MTHTHHNQDNPANSAASTAPEQLPEPASDLLEFSRLLQRLANYLASEETLHKLQQAIEQQDAQQVQQLVRDAAIPGEIRLDAHGRVVLMIRLGPIDGVIGISVPQA